MSALLAATGASSAAQGSLGIGAIIGAGAGGSIFTAGAQRRWASKQAVTARRWNLRLDMTQAQRRMADLERAGLNPILALGQGGIGGGSAQGAMAGTGTAASLPDTAATAFKARQDFAQRSQIRSQLLNDRQLRKTAGTQQDLNEALGLKAQADTHSAIATANRTNTLNRLEKARIPLAEMERDIDRSMIGKGLVIMNKAIGALNPFKKGTK